MFANLQRKNYHRNQCLMGVPRHGPGRVLLAELARLIEPCRSVTLERSDRVHGKSRHRKVGATPPNAKKVGVSPTQNCNLKKLFYLDMLRYVSDFYDIISSQRNWNIEIHRFNSTFFKNTSLHIENCISRA